MTPRLATMASRALMRRLPSELVQPLPEFDPDEARICPACGAVLRAGDTIMRGGSLNGLRSSDVSRSGHALGGRGAQCQRRIRCSERERKAMKKTS